MPKAGKPAAKLDLCQVHKDQYAAARAPVLLDLPPVPYLAIDGAGEPGGQQFTARIGGLYGAAYTLKFQSKLAGRDYKVCPLEALWWGPGEGGSFADLPPSQWQWKLLIRVPDFVGPADLRKAQEALRGKGKPPEFEDVRLETIEEGRCVQMLHDGPYAEEPRTMERMRQLAAAQDLAFRGRHHEIYLSDPRRVAPEKLRTILRMPVGPAGG